MIADRSEYFGGTICCAVRVNYSRNKTPGQWRAHSRYIMRESARGRSSTPAAFTGDNEFADISMTFAAWQKAGDERMFKLILSPEFGDRNPALPRASRRWTLWFVEFG